MKTSDLSTELVLAAIRKHAQITSNWAFLWDIQDELKDYPPKIVLSKLKNLKLKGVIDGCTCGCRGDFVIL